MEVIWSTVWQWYIVLLYVCVHDVCDLYIMNKGAIWCILNDRRVTRCDECKLVMKVCIMFIYMHHE